MVIESNDWKSLVFIFLGLITGTSWDHTIDGDGYGTDPLVGFDPFIIEDLIDDLFKVGAYFL